MFAFSKLRKKTRARGPRGCRASLILALCLNTQHECSGRPRPPEQGSEGPDGGTLARLQYAIAATRTPPFDGMESAIPRCRVRGAQSGRRSTGSSFAWPILLAVFLRSSHDAFAGLPKVFRLGRLGLGLGCAAYYRYLAALAVNRSRTARLERLRKHRRETRSRKKIGLQATRARWRAARLTGRFTQGPGFGTTQPGHDVDGGFRPVLQGGPDLSEVTQPGGKAVTSWDDMRKK